MNYEKLKWENQTLKNHTDKNFDIHSKFRGF